MISIEKLIRDCEHLLHDGETTLQHNADILTAVLQARLGRSGEADEGETQVSDHGELTACPVACLQEAYEEVGMKPDAAASRQAADATR
eukprot:14259441-Alexandrium_andersonii.AAC.1